MRASEIANRLGARGIPATRVGATTRASSEPAVEVLNPTRVPEPLNRRVEIRIKKPGSPWRETSKVRVDREDDVATSCDQ